MMKSGVLASVSTPAVLPEVEGIEETRTEVEQPWCVVVFNDEEHTYHYVIVVFCKVLQISVERAFKLAYEIDHCGEAVVATGLSRKAAEEIASAIAGYGPDPLMVERNVLGGKPLEGLKTLAREC